MRDRGWLLIGAAGAVALPAFYLRLGGVELAPVLGTLLLGLSILGAAFLLSWAAEAAEVEVSQAVAVALVALIAVLPEYAVDMVFAWKAGQDPVAFGAFPTANMTGANRLLIGVGWPLVLFLFWWRWRRPLELHRPLALELGVLAVATVYAFSIAARGNLTVVDFLVLGALFIFYIWLLRRMPAEEPELVGPAKLIGELPRARRRMLTGALFVYAALAIMAAAEPFADSLLHMGEELGIDQFLLVQWLAPLASEAPEVIVASLFVLKARPSAGLGVLISSKVNQWTLLVGMIPLVYAISAGGIEPLHLDGRQVEEILLTAAQSAFAVAVLANLRFSVWEALLLLVLFLGQLALPFTTVRYGFAAAYLVLTVLILASDRGRFLALWRLAREAVATPTGDPVSREEQRR